MRYIRQRDNYSCVPTSMLNLMKWLNVKCSAKDSMKKLKKLNETLPFEGSDVRPFPARIRKKLSKKVTVTPRFKFRFKDVLDHLSDENSSLIMINYFNEYRADCNDVVQWSHATFVESYDPVSDLVKAVNLYRGHTVTFISSDELKRLLSVNRRKKYERPMVIFFKRKDA